MHNLSLNNLGQTRSSQQRNHLLLTADTFVRTPLPGMKGCTAVVHAGPALGAAFAEYTAEFEAGGQLGSTSAQRFLYVIEGAIAVELNGKQSEVNPGGYAYFPESASHRVLARTISRVAVIRHCRVHSDNFYRTRCCVQVARDAAVRFRRICKVHSPRRTVAARPRCLTSDIQTIASSTLDRRRSS